VQTIQVVIDEKLLKATDVVARRSKLNRSSLIRNAIREHLKRLHNLELEQQERRAYKARPQQPEEYLPWLEIAAWPED
jgi:metal-responsive CopG/Arc/MetJ family transcriptional regulator